MPKIQTALSQKPLRKTEIPSLYKEFRADSVPLYTDSGLFRVSEFRPLSKNLELPKGYGPSSKLIDDILVYVNDFTAGGLDVDWDVLAREADSEHMHGKDIGKKPTDVGDRAGDLQPLWSPVPFDFSTETKEMKRDAHTKTCFNKQRSKSVPLSRERPDFRPSGCQTRWFHSSKALPGVAHGNWEKVPEGHKFVASDCPETKIDVSVLTLPTTSVVIVHHNEELSTLLRTIYSVLDRSPPQLLREIIIIDDGSDVNPAWYEKNGEFERHIGSLPKLKLARLEGRNGLMRARNIGIALSQGETVTILDSHVEVNRGWLEALMGRIGEGKAENIHRVVVPSIDSIHADTFEHTKGGISTLGHDWTLEQKTLDRPEAGPEVTAPQSSAIMAGGLLAFDRNWFNELGYYDPEMKLWGGEQFDLSFRIWSCGGTIECLPCARAGHVFRSKEYWQGQAYPVDGRMVIRNKRRVAAVWMDEYQILSNLALSPLPKKIGLGSFEYMRGIRKRLQCKPFKWYLENVLPELLPSAKRVIGEDTGNGPLLGNGHLRSPKENTCIDTLQKEDAEFELGAFGCHLQHGTQAMIQGRDGRIVIASGSFDSCLTRKVGGILPVMCAKCDPQNVNQVWVWEGESDHHPGMYHEPQTANESREGRPKACLTVVTPETGAKKLCTAQCDPSNESQLWEWETFGLPKNVYAN